MNEKSREEAEKEKRSGERETELSEMCKGDESERRENRRSN